MHKHRHEAGPRTDSRAAAALAVLLGMCLMSAPGLAAAQSLESFVLAAGGNSSGPLGGCTTFGPPAVVWPFFGVSIGVPLDGYAGCNIPSSMIDQPGTVGPLSNSVPSLSSSWFDGSFTGNCSSRANYGALSAAGHAAFVGNTNSTTVTGAEGFGRCRDLLTVTSPGVPNGQSGTIRFLVTVTGALSTNGNGGAYLQVNYQVNGSGGYYTMCGSTVYGATSLPSLSTLPGSSQAGFVLVPGSMSGSQELTTFAHPIVFGTPMQFDLGVMATAMPGATSTVDSHFDATISGIVITGPGGGTLANYAISAASGTAYGPAGVTGVGDATPRGGAVRFSASPNPGASRVRLSFTLPASTRARLGIYDSAGRLVRVLQDGPASAGVAQETVWDGRSDNGTPAPVGTYFARLLWNDESRTTRVVLLR